MSHVLLCLLITFSPVLQKVISVCNLLVSIKKLSLYMWPDDDEKLDHLRLSFVLRMLKSPHFNARYAGSSVVVSIRSNNNSNCELKIIKNKYHT